MVKIDVRQQLEIMWATFFFSLVLAPDQAQAEVAQLQRTPSIVACGRKNSKYYRQLDFKNAQPMSPKFN